MASGGAHTDLPLGQEQVSSCGGGIEGQLWTRLGGTSSSPSAQRSKAGEQTECRRRWTLVMQLCNHLSDVQLDKPPALADL